MNQSNFNSDTKNNYKTKLTCARASRRDGSSSVHSIRGSCTASDVYANWDEEGLLHLVHAVRPHDKHVKFPSTKPYLFTGFLHEKDADEINPVSVKLSFREENGKPRDNDRLNVEGDGMIFFDHFQVHGWATKVKNEHDEYQIELEVTKADEVGG